MAEDSKIEWTDHTFNPWRGCTKVSPGCQFCYAEKNMSVKLHGVKWGPNGNRIVASESYWKQPLKWNREAAEQFAIYEEHKHHGGPAYQRPRVFCASLADVFEDWQGPMLYPAGTYFESQAAICHGCGKWVHAPYQDCGGGRPGCDRLPRPATMQDVRKRLFDLIVGTTNLDWLLLTKRPENVRPMMERMEGWALVSAWDEWRCYPDNLDNVWLGVSVEDSKRKVRIDVLRTIPAAIRFLSIEPLLEDVGGLDLTGIHWAIVGGESGPGARPCNVQWVRSVVQQCKAAGVPCFVKQLGAKPIEVKECGLAPGSVALDTYDMPGGEPDDEIAPLSLRSKKGGDPDEWPADLRVREFPKVNLHTTVI